MHRDDTVGPEDEFAKILTQPVIFARVPRRLDLLRLRPTWSLSELKVNVHRNVPAEGVLAASLSFLAYAGYSADLEFGPYDDSLSFVGVPQVPADIEIVWIAFERYSSAPTRTAAFLVDRLRERRRATAAPILVMDSPAWDGSGAEMDINEAVGEAIADLPEVYLCPLSDLATSIGCSVVDDRASELIGWRISREGEIAVAQSLGLQWLPAALGRRIRGIAVDLDNTCYEGVLGEDGVDGLRVTEAHHELHRTLIRLREAGYFLAVVSRNDPRDVEDLFSRKTVLSLRAGHVDAWAVTPLGAKSEALAAAAATLGLAADTFLVIDDNPGEVADMLSRFPNMEPPLLARSPTGVVAALPHVPGVFRFFNAGVDALRVADRAANTQRSAIRQEKSSLDSYLASLETRLTFSVNPQSSHRRLAELSAKTNQFSTALARLDGADFAARISAPDSRVLGVCLRDLLTDSGLIGLIVGIQRADSTVEIEDICLSCRTLGRGIERTILQEALADLGEWGRVSSVFVARREGPRNQPALEWLESVGTRHDESLFEVPTPSRASGRAVMVEWNPSFC